MKIQKVGALTLFALLGYTFQVKSQQIDDLLKFSQGEQGASARMKAMGNAQTALGGDISSISGNPAGLGFFNQSDISIGFDYFGDKNKASYFGTNTDKGYGRVGLNQAGIVFNIPSYRARGGDLQTGWLNFNMGIGYAKTQSFTSKLNYAGINNESTFADYLSDEDAAQSYLGKFGYEMGLVDRLLDKNGKEYDSYPTNALGADQSDLNQYKGSQSETNLSFGANYSNVFYLGASIGFSAFNYDYDREFSEFGTMNSASGLQTVIDERVQWVNEGLPAGGQLAAGDIAPSQFLIDGSDLNHLLGNNYETKYTVAQTTRGRGVNAKLGMIFRPTPAFRIGISGTTPTWYNVTDEAQEYGDTWFDDAGTGNEIDHLKSNDDDGSFYQEYNFRTPYRLNGGLAYVFNEGLITGDVEFIGYNSMHYSYDSDRQTEDEINTTIKDTYKNALNYKVGAEYMLAPQFLIRGGYNYNSSPYKNDIDVHSQVVSGGFGYRFDHMYVDLTYQNATYSRSFSPYLLDTEYTGVPSPVVDYKNTRNNVFLTIGAKF